MIGFNTNVAYLLRRVFHIFTDLVTSLNLIFSLSLLNQAKKLVESLPQEIRANVSKEEAEKLKASLEAAGGTVVLE